MCGISGIFEFAQQTDFTSQVKAMNAALAHRGPDNDGLFSDAGITLGHRRLSIIDLSAAGNQPMYAADGRYVLVFNGEIYNYRELKNELPDVHFKTGSDTEVLLMAWTRWGAACLDKLNGMFAFALWDKQERKLHLVRDRLGIKPVYIFKDKKQVAFASEIRGLMASRLFVPTLNAAALGDYLRYQTVHAPATIVQGVTMLMPGHRLEIDETGVQEMCWWKLPDAKNEATENYDTIKKNVRDLLRAAVERRLVADVPFGAFLSGGIDSSAVVGLMREVSTTTVNTFSVTFDDSEFSEAVYARLIAKKFDTKHHEIKLRPADFLNDLPNALLAMDHPSGDGPNTYIVSKATKQAGITMALSGLGGDELFAGYAIFKQAYSLQQKKWINSIPRFMRGAGGNLLRTVKPGIASDKMAEVLQRDQIRFDTFYPLSRQVLLEEQVQKILSKPIADPCVVEQTAKTALEKTDATHFFSAVSLAEIQTYMQNILIR
ncbi:MAG: asparagine synthase (glutamine-hydrolyzing), partial [Bacteroidia bacterium]